MGDGAAEPALPIDERVWQAACELASRARRAGKTIPASDILIYAYARQHGAAVEHADAHFDVLAQLWRVVITLASVGSSLRVIRPLACRGAESS